MTRILLFLFLIIQATPGLASDPSLLPGASSVEASLKPAELRKIASLLENSAEREKLLKTLRALAAAQEAKESKKGSLLISYFTPIVDFCKDGASLFLTDLKKIPDLIKSIGDFFALEKNRDDFWAAVMRLPLLIGIGILFEGGLAWFLRRRLVRKQADMTEAELAEKKRAYAYIALFGSFLYSPLFLPFLASNSSVGNWIISLWLMVFAIRIIYLERKTPPFDLLADPEISPQTHSKKMPFLLIVGSFFIVAIALLFLLNSVFNIQSCGGDFMFNLTLIMGFPLLVWHVREWKRKDIPRYLNESRTLATAPSNMAVPVNGCIRYLPWLLLGTIFFLILDKIFLGKGLWEAYRLETLGSFLMLFLFVEGRRRIDGLARYPLPKHALTSHLASVQVLFTRSIQWVWHLSFFGLLMGIWNNFFSSFFVSIISHPFTKTMAMVGLTWSIIYLLWLGLDSFVQFHTKSQWVKGKRREPTVFAKTFGPMLHSVARWVMVLVAIFVMLEAFGFDLKILVYMMSAFALAISLGAQSLVKDVINGFFALVDGSFAVGEVVTVGAHTGTVESLSLRAVTLRHKDGSLQTIPFSEVGNIINRSRDYTLVPISISTSYRTKIGLVYEALNKTAEEMANDPTFGNMILEPLSISGIDRFAENAVSVSASIKIRPDPKETFLREFNRRLKGHMDALKITPPIAFHEVWE